jgi:hypothetical protein
MIFSNDQTTNEALLNTLGEEQAAAWVRFYAIEVDSRPSMIGRSPPPRDWTPRSPSSSRHPEDGLRPTGHFDLSRTPAASLLGLSPAPSSRPRPQGTLSRHAGYGGHESLSSLQQIVNTD